MSWWRTRRFSSSTRMRSSLATSSGRNIRPGSWERGNSASCSTKAEQEVERVGNSQNARPRVHPSTVKPKEGTMAAIKKKEVKIGGYYAIRHTSSNPGMLSVIRIEGVSQYGGWNATNLKTGRLIRIKAAT